jgi:hypothetical protein
MPFVSFTAGVVAKSRARSNFRSAPEDIVKDIERGCAEIAAEMQCPCHHKNARVYVDGGNLDHLDIEIICCCDRFAKRVREALKKADPLGLADGSS